MTEDMSKALNTGYYRASIFGSWDVMVDWKLGLPAPRKSILPPKMINMKTLRYSFY